ncbi:hypothetical protein TELCIR_22305 [Teladorsagia circumcincta]|uniref:Uncharacterized protein n=1 Tax=Teladorsagia circumcincta TaxID=45464 RepID=A0A2G9TE96_TELCI|nr:hypothetical protein TELCIR_22305 [Teladorsagia circumcincta]
MDITMPSASSGSSDSLCWPTTDEKVNVEDDKDNWSVKEVHKDELASNGVGIRCPEGARVLPFITVERKGEKVQFAAKKPRMNSMCSTMSVASSVATVLVSSITI